VTSQNLESLLERINLLLVVGDDNGVNNRVRDGYIGAVRVYVHINVAGFTACSGGSSLVLRDEGLGARNRCVRSTAANCLALEVLE
jgi:hypothetical protein